MFSPPVCVYNSRRNKDEVYVETSTDTLEDRKRTSGTQPDNFSYSMVLPYCTGTLSPWLSSLENSPDH